MSAVLIAGMVTSVQSPVVSEATPTAGPETQAAPSGVVKSRPDTVSARLAAESQASRVQVTSLDTSNSTTFVNADGSMSTETSVTPLRVMRDGGWVPVDYDLEHVGDSWIPKAAPIPVSFSDGGDRDAATIGDGSKQVDLSWAVTLPAPTVDGATASYLLGDGQTLTLTATVRGFEQSLVLAHAPTTLPQVKLPLDTADLTMSADTADGYTFKTDAGKVVYAIRAPVMYDSSQDPLTGDPQSKVVDSTLVSTSNGARLDLAPSLAWLTDPARQYPVTIDPSLSAGAGTGSDTFVEQGTTAVQGGVSQLRLGEDVGDHPSRTYMSFGALAQLTGKDITSATLKVWNNRARSCTATTLYAYPLSAAFAWNSTVWTNKPAANPSTTYSTSASFAHGTTGCNPAYESVDVKKMVSGWATKSIPNYGVQLSGHEAAGAQYWYICSMNYDPDASTSCNSAAHTPVLTVNYNSYPGASQGRTIAPCTAQCASPVLTNTLTPSVSDKFNDSDGGKLRYDYYVYSGTVGAPGALVVAGSTNTSSGLVATWKVPTGKLSKDTDYVVRTRAWDGIDYGPWSAYTQFRVDTTAPATPAITSPDWTNGQWSNQTSGTINWSSASTDAATYSYKIDSSAWSAESTQKTKSLSLSTDSVHAISVRTTDKAGNISEPSVFSVRLGNGVATSPHQGERTQSTVVLSAEGPSSTPYVTYQWRVGQSKPWAAVPSADVKTQDGTPAPSAWPNVATVGSYVWSVDQTIRQAGGSGGPVDVQACFSASASGSNPVCQSKPITFEFALSGVGESTASSDLGPGTLGLSDGSFSLHSDDAEITTATGTLAIGRTATNVSAGDPVRPAVGIFGPGWTADFHGSEAGQADRVARIANDKSYVILRGPDRSQRVYVATTPLNSSPISYVGVGDANDGSTMTLGDVALTVVDPDGTSTVWSEQAGQWLPASVSEPGDSSTTTTGYFYATVDGVAGLLTRIVAPTPAGLDCGTDASARTTPGCRSLALRYAPLAGSGGGERLVGVDLVAADPSSGAMTTTALEAYDYDSSGHLAHEWDPRVSPSLKASYSYSGDKVAIYKPAGLAAWSFLYDANDRISAVSRTDDAGTVAKMSVVYDVPLSGDGLPDVRAATTASWGQDDAAKIGTAVFPPSHVLQSSLASGQNAGDWKYATIAYFDTNGREVNRAEYGAGDWQVDVTQYDATGSLDWTLSAQNRREALTPDTTTDPTVSAQSSSQTRASLLTTQYNYNADGTELTDTSGPMHPVRLDDGRTIDARSHAHVVYDENAPQSNQPFRLETTRTTSVTALDGTEYEAYTVHTAYDALVTGDTSGWTLRAATRAPTDGGLSAGTRYGADGNMTEDRPPTDPQGTSAASTKFEYYKASGSGSCVDASQAGFVCQVSPVVQPSGNAVVSRSYRYDRFGNPKQKLETYGSGSSAVVRTTSTTFDAAERQTAQSVTVGPVGALGAAVPDQSFTYDSQSGLPATTTTAPGSAASTTSSAYDVFGRLARYTDASGTQSSYSYDADGHIQSVDDGLGKTTYGYDTTDEHRGLVTSEDFGLGAGLQPMHFTYDSDGTLLRSQLPNGVTRSVSADNAGNRVGLQYATADSNWLSYQRQPDSTGATSVLSTPDATQSYKRDGSGLLLSGAVVTADAQTSGNVCATTKWTGDASKITATTFPDDGSDPTNGGCTTQSTGTASADNFDTAGRIQGGGWSLDAAGRASSIPSTSAVALGYTSSATGSVTLSYASNDAVLSQMQDGQTTSFQMDPLLSRAKSVTMSGASSLQHYTSDDETVAAWQGADDGSWTRNLSDPWGQPVGTATAAGAKFLMTDSSGAITAVSNADGSGNAQLLSYVSSASESRSVPSSGGISPEMYVYHWFTVPASSPYPLDRTPLRRGYFDLTADKKGNYKRSGFGWTKIRKKHKEMASIPLIDTVILNSDSFHDPAPGQDDYVFKMTKKKLRQRCQPTALNKNDNWARVIVTLTPSGVVTGRKYKVVPYPQYGMGVNTAYGSPEKPTIKNS